MCHERYGTRITVCWTTTSTPEEPPRLIERGPGSSYRTTHLTTDTSPAFIFPRRMNPDSTALDFGAPWPQRNQSDLRASIGRPARGPDGPRIATHPRPLSSITRHPESTRPVTARDSTREERHSTRVTNTAGEPAVHVLGSTRPVTALESARVGQDSTRAANMAGVTNVHHRKCNVELISAHVFRVDSVLSSHQHPSFRRKLSLLRF
jgi:hypothetical protein